MVTKPSSAVLEERVDDDQQQADEAGEQAALELLAAEGRRMICSSVWTSKLIGRAPNLSWSARALADSWVKLPVMLAGRR